MSLLPRPYRLGLPSTFRKWRRYQARTILSLVDSPKRFLALVAPTGSGKSLDYAAYLRLAFPHGKSMILAETKYQQNQIASAFSALGYVDVRGKSNYDCAIDPPYTVDLGPCTTGQRCDLMRDGCSYYDTVRAAKAPSTRVSVSNYSWWLYHNKYGAGFPPVDCLVLDEAHHAPDSLASFLSVVMGGEHMRLMDYREPPDTKWSRWAKHAHTALEQEIEEELKPRALHSRAGRLRLRTAAHLLTKLALLSTARERDWVFEHGVSYSRKPFWRWDPVWPGPYSEMLFRKTKKVILVSATMRPKTLALLGIDREDYDFQEVPSTFPVGRRPVIHFRGLPRVALTHRSSDAVLRLWLTRLDNFIERRLDRKGIVHCVSYARRDFLKRNSRHRALFIDHDSGRQEEAVERFKRAKAPAIFISPSATTGLNFPEDECRYAIIAKVPFPDQRSKILKARSKRDRDYPMYLTMMDVVQAAGRGMRSADDWCEVVIIDDQWSWFSRKYRRFAPQWFLDACVSVESQPPPLTFAS